MNFHENIILFYFLHKNVGGKMKSISTKTHGLRRNRRSLWILFEVTDIITHSVDTYKQIR